MSSMSGMDSTPTISYEDLTDPDGWVPLAKRESLSIGRICCICASMLAFQVGYAIEFGLFGPMLGDFKEDPIIKFPEMAEKIIWWIPPICGFFVQPLIGFASDGCQFRYGRRRIFILTGAIGIFLGFLGLYFLRDITHYFAKVGGVALGVTFVYFLFIEINVAINILQGPSRSLVGDVVPPSQQVLSNTIGSLMLGLAQVLTNFIHGFSIGTQIGFKTNDQFVFIIGMVIIVISTAITIVAAREERFRDTLDRQNPFTELYIAFRTMPREVWRVSIVYLCSWAAYNQFNSQTTNFFTNDIFPQDKKQEGTSFGMLVIGVANLLVMIYSPFQTKLIDTVGLKWAYALSQIIEAVCLLCIFFITNKYALLAICAPMGIASAVFNSVPFAVVGVVVSKEKMGLFMGALNSFAVIGQQIGNLVCIMAVPKIEQAITGKNTMHYAYVLGTGTIFAVISAFLCKIIIVPQQDKEMLEPVLRD